MRPALLVAALLFVASALAACGGRAVPANALIDGKAVTAVTVAWDPVVKGAPAPRRTTDRGAFAPLLAALGKVEQKVEPYDLLGPPTHITLELKGGGVRKLQLWGGYLVDTDARVTYYVSEDLFNDLRMALEPLQPPPIGAPARLSGTVTVPQLVEALKAHGAEDARQTGEQIRFLLFNARGGEVIELLGHTVQVYEMASPEEAKKIAALDPHDMPIEWIAPPRFVAVGNLVVTVVIPEQVIAEKVVAYLQMVRQ